MVLHPPYGLLLSTTKRFGRGEGAAFALGAAAHGCTRQRLLAELVHMVCRHEHGRQRRAHTLWLRLSNILFHKHKHHRFVFSIRIFRAVLRLHGNGLQVTFSIYFAMSTRTRRWWTSRRESPVSATR